MAYPALSASMDRDSSILSEESHAHTKTKKSDRFSKKRRLESDSESDLTSDDKESLPTADTDYTKELCAFGRSFLLRHRIVGYSAIRQPTCFIDDSICDLCYQFIESFLCKQTKDFPRSKWERYDIPGYTEKSPPVFHHYTTTRALLNSVKSGCQLCEVITKSTGFFNGGEMVLTPANWWKDYRFKARAAQFGFIPHRRDHFTILPLKSIGPTAPKSQDLFEFVLAKDEKECYSSSAEHDQYPCRFADSDQCFNQLRTWYADCHERHEKCARPKRYLPTRLLDIDPDGKESKSICLRRTDDLSNGPETVQYVALTYCWGSAQNLVTDRANMQDHMRGIPLQVLPQVVKDAIVVTRRLDIRYLWIDALCICQDDDTEWQNEAENMSNVYGGSSLTISAMSSSNPTKGFLRNRNLDVVRLGKAEVSYGTWNDPVQLFIRRIPRHIEDEFRQSNLNQRAWALQERVLAPSVIHWCSDQMIWECNTHHLLSETGAHEPSGKVVIRLSDTDGTSEHFSRRDLWDSIVDAYSCRKLTKLEDRLVAISGIATRLRIDNLRQDRYVAGLWEDDLDFQLAWCSRNGQFIHGQKLKPQREIPTWSWAHWNRAAFLILREPLTSALTKPPTFVFSNPDEDLQSKTAGRTVKFAMVKLYGYLQRVGDTAIRTESILIEDDRTGEIEYRGLPGTNSRWDFDSELKGTGRHFCLRLLEHRANDSFPVSEIVYLVLKEADSFPDGFVVPRRDAVYRRVGLLKLKHISVENFARPYPDVLFENGKPLLTHGEWREIYLI